MTRLVAMFLVVMLAIPTLAIGATKPNIVYILADDMGYGDVGAYNPQSKIPTPAMNAVAAQGMRFTDAHTGAAVCTPTRYGILTGRYAWRSRLKRGVLYGYDEPLIEDGRLTVPTLLKQHGYATACAGKWHLGLGWHQRAPFPENATPFATTTRATEVMIDLARPLTAGPHTTGFDYSFIIPASLDMDPYVYIEDGKVVEQPTARVEASPRPKMWRAGPIAPSFKFENVLGDFTARAEAFIDRSAAGAKDGKPFFLYLPLNSPHTPHIPSAKFAGKSELGSYGDFQMETDWAVGRVTDALRRNGLNKNTIVIVTSDNGSHAEPLDLEAKGHKSNGDWRGQKSDAWEAGHRVPFIVRWPAKVNPGTTCEQTICTTDLMATAAQIVGVPLGDDAGEDSVSILGLLDGSTTGPTREATVHHSVDGTFAIRQDDWKLIACRGSGGWSLREPAAKKQNLPPIQLYNLRNDPGETKNVAAEQKAVVERLQTLLAKYQSEGRSVPRRAKAS
ncbi:MAG: arylsulfatase [Planctomycetota bacterium]|nr:arylsulfatase [Planctomycetota bacterium]